MLNNSDPTNFTFVRPTSAEGKEEPYCVAACPPPDVHYDPEAYKACFKACQASHARGFQLAACTSDTSTTQWVYRSTSDTTSGQLLLTKDASRASWFYLFEARAPHPTPEIPPPPPPRVWVHMAWCARVLGAAAPPPLTHPP